MIARKDRNSDNWFLGAIGDEQERSFDVALGFLAPGEKAAVTGASFVSAGMKSEVG